MCRAQDPGPQLKGQGHTLRSKVTFKDFRFHIITLSFLYLFSNSLAQMFTSMRWCVTRKTQVSSFKVKVTLEGQRSHSKIFVSAPWLCHSFLDFQIVWHKRLPAWDDVSHVRRRSETSRSRSHLKVKCHIQRFSLPHHNSVIPLHIFK